MPVKHLDLCITATDGLFDNVFPAEICSIVNQSKLTEEINDIRYINKKEVCPKWSESITKELNVLANEMVQITQIAASSYKRISPFTMSARHYGLRMPGGKMDDITIIVSLVYNKPPPTTQ